MAKIHRSNEGVVEISDTNDLYPSNPSTIKWSDIRQKRDRKLRKADWYVTRHIEEKDGGINTTLSSAEYEKLLSWRQDLRNIPEDYANASDVSFPLSSKPGFAETGRTNTHSKKRKPSDETR